MNKIIQLFVRKQICLQTSIMLVSRVLILFGKGSRFIENKFQTRITIPESVSIPLTDRCVKQFALPYQSSYMLLDVMYIHLLHNDFFFFQICCYQIININYIKGSDFMSYCLECLGKCACLCVNRVRFNILVLLRITNSEKQKLVLIG